MELLLCAPTGNVTVELLLKKVVHGAYCTVTHGAPIDLYDRHNATTAERENLTCVVEVFNRHLADLDAAQLSRDT